MNEKKPVELRLSLSKWTKARQLFSWVFFSVRIFVYAFEKCNWLHNFIAKLWEDLF